MDFTKEEFEELKLFLFERAKAKKIKEIEDAARVEMTAVLARGNAERIKIMAEIAPIEAKMKADVLTIKAIQSVEGIG